MSHTPLSREQVLKAIGDADDAAVAAIIAMGTTAEELEEAQAWIANDEPLLNTGRPLPSGRVSKVADLLARLDEEKALAGRGDE